MQNTDYEYKVDGYNELFLDPATRQPRLFHHNGLEVRVVLAMHNPHASQSPLGYQNYWYDHPREILERMNELAFKVGGL